MKCAVVLVALVVVGSDIGSMPLAGARPTTRPAASQPTSRPEPTSRPASQAIKGKTTGPRAVCARHMGILLQASELWANENNGMLPPDLTALFGEDLLDLRPDVVRCPNDGATKPPANWAKLDRAAQVAWAVKHTSYVWEGGGLRLFDALSGGHAEEIIVITERTTDHPNDGGGMNVGFADNHVAFVKAADLAAVRAKDKAARAALKKASKREASGAIQN